MKVLSVFLLLLLPYCSHALSRHNTASFALHSIFDAPSPTPSMIQAGYPSPALNVALMRTSPYRGDGNNKLNTGITLLVLGAACLAGAAASFYAADRQAEESRKIGGSKAADMGYELLGLACLGAGFGLGIPGLVMTIKYSSGGGEGRRRRWYR